MAANRELTVDLDLDRIEDLYEPPATSPLSPSYGPHNTQPALEYISDELRANRTYRSARARFTLPSDSGATQDEIRAGVHRWGAVQASRITRDIAENRRRGLRMLLAAIPAFAVFIALSELIGTQDSDLASTISRGLEVAAWVVLWFPIDALIFASWQHRMDRRCANIVADMDVTIASN